MEWDIKNNYVMKNLAKININYLSALVLEDQLVKRNGKKFQYSIGVGSCFAFMEKNNCDKSLLVNLTFDQDKFLRDMYKKYQSIEQCSHPFTEKWFIYNFRKITYKYSFKPRMLVSGCFKPDMHLLFKLCRLRSFCDGSLYTIYKLPTRL